MVYKPTNISGGAHLVESSRSLLRESLYVEIHCGCPWRLVKTCGYLIQVYSIFSHHLPSDKLAFSYGRWPFIDIYSVFSHQKW